MARKKVEKKVGKTETEIVKVEKKKSEKPIHAVINTNQTKLPDYTINNQQYSPDLLRKKFEEECTGLSKKIGNTKYSETDVIKFLAGMWEWANRPDTLYITSYWLDPVTDHSISYDTLKKEVYYRFPYLKEKYKEISELMAMKLLHAGATGKLYFGAIKFVLQNRYGWTEKTEQDITLSQKTTSFKFDNQIEDNDNTEDVDFKEINPGE